jgi:hypothetical protein
MRFFWGKVMKYLRFVFAFCLITLLAGCESSSVVMRQAPREGVQVTGLNVLFRIEPLTAVGGPSVPRSAITGPRPIEEAERLGNEIKERLIPQFQAKGIMADYASVQVIRGVAPPSLNLLFPGGQAKHLLVITPVAANVTCSSLSCATRFTLSLSLRAPVDNREVWNLRLVQSEMTPTNWIGSRNHAMIDDIAKAVLAVVRPR